MDVLAKFAQQLRDVWEGANSTYRVAFAAAIVFVVATMGGVGYWASRPQYVPLADNLSATEAAAIVDRLSSQNIPAEMSFSGSTILVPDGQWNEARLAVSDVLGETGDAAADGMGSIWDAPDTREARLRREREQFLARSIARIKSVSSAEVHLALPRHSPFPRQQVEATASVIVGTRGSNSLSPDQAASIAAMVAASVDRLKTPNVTVTDLSGKTLYPKPTGGWSNHYEHKQQVEADLSAKAESILARSLGAGRAVVRLTAELDFTEEQTEQLVYSPDGNVKVSEMVDNTETTGGTATAAGAAGAASNLGAVGGNAGAVGATTKSEKLETEYLSGKETTTIHRPPGRIKRLSISALVDIPTAAAGTAAAGATATAAPTIDLAKATSLIKQAVGFDETRGDEITVESSPLTGLDSEVETLVDTLNRWDFYNNLVKNASLGVAAVVALVLGLLFVRKLQPVGTIAAPAVESSRSAVMNELSEQAKQNPEIVSQIVNAWLNSPATVPMTSGGPAPDTGEARKAA